MKKYVLCAVVENEICEPKFFDSYWEAYAQMRKEYEEMTGFLVIDEDYEDEEGDHEIGEWNAYCKSTDHDNWDWKIFKMEVER